MITMIIIIIIIEITMILMYLLNFIKKIVHRLVVLLVPGQFLFCVWSGERVWIDLLDAVFNGKLVRAFACNTESKLPMSLVKL